MSLETRWLPALIVALALGTAAAAEPPLRLSEDGAAFLYRSQPGDQPGAVAERFGVRQADVAAFLVANGITDPTRVAVGHQYRIPNPLAARVGEAETRATALAAEADAAHSKVRELEGELATHTARSDELEGRAAGLERLARLWPWMQLLGITLVFGLGAAGWVAYQSAARLSEAERYARGLGSELDERRRLALAERQQAARRILDLEDEVRGLDQQLTLHGASHRRPTGTH